MGVVVPVGEMQASFVFEQANSAKQVTWTLGIAENITISPAEMPEALYGAFSMGTESPSTAPYAFSNMSVAWTFVGVSVAESTMSGPLVFQYFDPIQGDQTLFPLPINCAYLATKSTALGGRKNRGRAYLPPCNLTEGNINGGGQIESPYDVELQEMYDGAFTVLDTLTIVPVLHHSDGSAGTPITGFSIGNTIATQRRRLR